MFVNEKIAELKEVLAQHPAQKIVLATYLRKDFEEIRPGEDYDQFKKAEREFIEALAKVGLQSAIAFQDVDAAGYYRYLAEKELPDGNPARAAYATYKFIREHGEQEQHKSLFDIDLIRYGLIDENGEIYGVSKIPYADDNDDDAQVILFPNPTWEPSDWTDNNDKEHPNWILADHLGDMFNELVAGLNTVDVAKKLNINLSDLYDMTDGLCPIPENIWREVEKMHVEFLAKEQ